MATYEHKSTRRQMHVSGAAAEAQYDADPTWRLVPELTPKERLQADAAALGLSTDGTNADLTARIEARKAPLSKDEIVAAALAGFPVNGPDAPSAAWIRSELERLPLTDEEKLLAADAKLIKSVDAEHDPAEVRAKLAELAAK